jgi:hypothetical protein
MTGGWENEPFIALMGEEGARKEIEFIPKAQQPLVGQGLLIIEASRS